MANDLQGLHLLVTRPAPAGELLCEQITERGGYALHFPVIAFAPPADPSGFLQAINAMNAQDWLVFNSPQAVSATLPALRARWPELPVTVRFAAVGAGTAAALQAAGFSSILFPHEEWSSEGLLAMPEFQQVSGQHIMIVRGVGGREYLEKIFAERDAVVTSCMAYQRILPEMDKTACREAMKQQKFHAMIAGSFESVTNLKLLLGESVWPELSATPLIVMSERIKHLAAEVGFQTIWIAPNASQQALLMMLSEKREVLCQMKKTK